jgi:hypothetical protein
MRPARKVLLSIAAMAVGLMLGAATKFGLGYDLSVVAPSSPKVLATQ